MRDLIVSMIQKNDTFLPQHSDILVSEDKCKGAEMNSYVWKRVMGVLASGIVLMGCSSDNPVSAVVAYDDNITVSTEESYILIDVLKNDLYKLASGDTLNVTIKEGPSKGTVTVVDIKDKPQIKYEPESGYVGTDTFRYCAFAVDPSGTKVGDCADVDVTVVSGDEDPDDGSGDGGATDDDSDDTGGTENTPHEKVFFGWDDGTHGLEPWVSDGTDEGTKMLKDIMPDGDYSSPYFPSITIADNTFFVADTNNYIRKIWKTDGTPNGTVLTGSAGDLQGMDIVHIGTSIYYITTEDNESTTLRKMGGDGNNEDILVENFGDYSDTGITPPGYLRAVGDKLLFQKDNDAGNGANWNPWFSNGLDPAERVGGSTFEGNYDSFSWNGVVYHNKYFTSANDRNTGDEVWMWDYAANTVELLLDINDDGTKGSSPDNFTVVGDKLYFTATNPRVSGDAEEYDASLWITDGTKTNTLVIKDDEATPPDVGTRNRFSDMTVMSDKLFFCYLQVNEDGEAIGRGTLWRSEGSAASTVQVNDINLTSGTLKATDDTLFFWVEGDEAVQGIWASKGDETSTHRIKAFSTDVYWFDSFVKDGIYYFILDNADNGKREFWRSDGTETGTFKLLEKEMIFG